MGCVMARPTKKRPHFTGGFLPLKRSIFDDLSDWRPALRDFYVQLLALSFYGSYSGQLGFPEQPMSKPDIAAATHTEVSQAYRLIKELRRMRIPDAAGEDMPMLAYYYPNGDARPAHYWLPHYALFVDTDSAE